MSSEKSELDKEGLNQPARSAYVSPPPYPHHSMAQQGFLAPEPYEIGQQSLEPGVLPSNTSQVSSLYVGNIVQQQPAPIVYYPQDDRNIPVPDHLCLSIFTTLCCCICFGIGAIVLSSQANSLKHVDRRAAAAKAKTAMHLNIVGIVCGVVILVIYGILQYMAFQSYY